MDCARIPLGTGGAFDAFMIQPFRDLLWRDSANKLAKYAFDDRRLRRLNLSLARRDGCAGDRPHHPVAEAQSAAGFSRLDSPTEAPTGLIRKIL
jgi:hypothetical protein